jgi:hypothetical protein
MRSLILFVVSAGLVGASMLFGGATAADGVKHEAQAQKGVRLILLLTVDQFRADYLWRFSAEFDGGLARLRQDGAVFLNAHLEHYPTVTAVGHATFGSGALPSTSGIIGNDWFDRATGKSVTSVVDDQVKPLGGSATRGASPHRLLVSTIADEIKLAGRPGGAAAAPRAVGVSFKDRSAILPVGRSADAAYWLDTPSGEFVSSTYYFDALPAWVRQFNEQKIGQTYAGHSWPFMPAAPAETARVLPATPGTELNSAVSASPFGNSLLARFAEAAVDAEQLGQRDTVDVLAVSLSSNDSIGHTYGPDSPEVRSVTLQTDKAIGALFAALDRKIGLNRVLVVFTSDHGVAPLPERAASLRLPGGRLTSDDLFGPMRKALAQRFGPGDWIQGTAGTSPYLNHALLTERGVDPAAARAVAAAAATTVPQVARVYTRDQLLLGDVPSDTISRRVVESYHRDRSGDLEIILHPFWIRQKTGTTHGTPYSYDSHIPLVIMGPGIRPGRYARHVSLNDVAPTLATALGIAAPAASAGRALNDLIATSPVSSSQQ